MMLRACSQKSDFQTILFSFLRYAVYMFVFLLTELVLYDRTAAVLGGAHVTRVYSVNLIFVALGYFCFARVFPRMQSLSHRKRFFSLIVLIYIVLIAAAVFLHVPPVYPLIGFLTMFSLGYLGGAVHYDTATELYLHPCSARVTAFAIAAATFLQYFVQNHMAGGERGLALCLVAGALLLLALVLYLSPVPGNASIASAGGGENRALRKKLYFLILLAVLMSLIVGIKDGVVTELHAKGELNIGGYPRLFFALGLVVAGVAADFRQRRYLGIATAVTLIFSTITSFYLNDPNSYALALSVFYFYGGFYVTFNTVAFLDVAPETDHPALWAGMGRICRSLTAGLSAAPAALLFAHMGGAAILLLNTALTMAAVAAFFGAGKFGRAENGNAVFYDESVFAAEKSFTARETEIFCKLLASDRNLKEVAAELFISERVLQRHLTSMYEKTGTSSRAALLRVYYEAKSAAEKFAD